MAEGVSGHGTLTRAFVTVTATLSLAIGLVGAVVAVRWVQVRHRGPHDGFRVIVVAVHGHAASTC